MRLFVQIEVESECCQKYGICGEQYSLDVVFDDLGRVETTRFRFQHTPLKYQKDFIAALVETRKATDIYATRLKQNEYHTVNPGEINRVEDFNAPESVRFFQKAKQYMLGKSASEVGSDSSVPSVFCYSLFYVYYD